VTDGETGVSWFTPSGAIGIAPGSMVADTALDTFDVSVELPPGKMELVEALNERAGMAPTVTVAVDCTCVPAALVTVSV